MKERNNLQFNTGFAKYAMNYIFVLEIDREGWSPPGRDGMVIKGKNKE